MKKFLVIFLLVMLSCSDSIDSIGSKEIRGESVDSTIQNKQKLLTEAWICHNPGTEHHDEICIEDLYPIGCFVQGDNSKFCWLLVEKDCSGDLLNEWQTNNCHHLKGD